MKIMNKGLAVLVSMLIIIMSSSISTKAAFTFDAAPSNFNFGNVPYPANAPVSRTLTSGTYTVRVTDTRSLIFSNGYKVTVSAPKLTGTNNPTENIMMGNNILMQSPTLSQIGGILGIGPTVTNSFYVDAVDSNGNALSTTVLRAARGGILVGLLTWLATWPPSNISFNMATREASVDVYTTTITWTLYDAP
jgi:hypothetical protein